MKLEAPWEQVRRRFARDQWVRLHGTPRVTVLVGADVVAAYRAWLTVQSQDCTFFDGEVDSAARQACGFASQNPHHTTALVTTKPALEGWRRNRRDRVAAMVDEGVISIEPSVGDDAATSPRPPGPPSAFSDARSAAEALLFEALEASPSTAGRFKLNEYLSVRFGSNACEVDLLSRLDGIAVEVDGYHHFSDLDAYRRDRRKDLLLQTQGLIVVRVLAEDVMKDVRASVHLVHQALAFRGST